MVEKKYIALSQTLEKYICDHKVCGRLPGLYKLAEELQVNHVTLRKAIRVLAEQNKLQIIPHDGTYVVQSHTVREKFHVLGFVGLSFKGETVEKLFEELNYSLAPLGYRAMNIASNSALFDEDPKLIVGLPVDCFSLFGAVTRNIANALLEAKIPTICTINSNFPEFNHVGMDHKEAYTRAIRIMKEKGCRRIAFFGYQRRKEFQNYLENIHHVFLQELGSDYEEKFFKIYDHLHFYAEYRERYHEVMVHDVMKTWSPDFPDAVITLHDATPFFKHIRPSMKIAEFVPNFMMNTLADVSFYEDNASMLSISAKRMLEILGGDTSLTEIRIPFIMKDNTLNKL